MDDVVGIVPIDVKRTDVRATSHLKLCKMIRQGRLLLSLLVAFGLLAQRAF